MRRFLSRRQLSFSFIDACNGFAVELPWQRHSVDDCRRYTPFATREAYRKEFWTKITVSMKGGYRVNEPVSEV